MNARGLLWCVLLPVVATAQAEVDRDKDGLSDFAEIHKYRTDPKKADTDGDGVPDGDWLERREYQYTIRTVLQVMRPVTIRAPEASLCNARRPAPTSSGTISAAWVVQNVAVAALSRMVACAPALVREGQAVTKGHMMVMTLAGQGRDGEPFGTFLLDSTAGGGGAYIDHDGLDGSGDYVPRPTLPDRNLDQRVSPRTDTSAAPVPATPAPTQPSGGR